MRSFLSVLMAAMLFLSACGDSDAASSGDDDVSTGAVANSSNDGVSADTTAAPTTTAQPAGSANSDWCQDARDIADRSDEIEAMEISFGDQFKLMFEEILPRMRASVPNAPADLDVDWDYFFAKFDEFEELLSDVEYQVFSLSDEQLDLFDDELMDQYDDAIDEYNETVCRISGDVDNVDELGSAILSDDDIDALLTGPRRAETLAGLTALGIDEDVAECVMRGLLSQGSALGIDPTSPEFFESLSECGMSPSDLASLGVSDVAGRDTTEGFEEAAEFLAALAGNPAAASAILPLLLGFGVDADAAQCLVDTIGAADSADAFSDGDGFANLLEGCGMSLSDLAILAG